MLRPCFIRPFLAPAFLAAALAPVATTLALAPQEAREIEIETSSTSVEQYRSQTNDGPSVSLRIENGEVAEVLVDDEKVSADRVRREGDAWIVSGADGAELARFGAASEAEPRVVVRRFRGDGGSGAVQAFAEAQATRDGMRVRGSVPRPAPGASRPKAMMGIGLGQVDGALAHHLGIDPAKSTMVTFLVDGAPAEKAGLEEFDVIVSVNGDADASPDAIRRLTATAEPGAKVALEIQRRGERKIFELELAPFAADEATPAVVMGEPVFEWMAEGPDGAIAEIQAMLGGDEVEVGGDGTMFFFGPDGERQELRIMRGMPLLPPGPFPGMQGMDPGMFEAQMDEFARRMEAWGERFQRRMEERMRGGGRMPMPRGAFEPGEVEVWIERQGEGDGEDGMPAPRRPRAAPGAPRDGAPAMNDDRIRRLEEQGERIHRLEEQSERLRRLEEQMERLMRELEKANARGGRAPSDA